MKKSTNNSRTWLPSIQQRVAEPLKESRVRFSLITTFILCGVYFLAPEKIGFLSLRSEDSTIINNILFPLFHANIFHLACNLLCIWQLRPPYYIIPACAISFLASLLPEYSLFSLLSPLSTPLPIMGISGILFAIVGIKFGKLQKFRLMLSRTWLFLLITAFIPNVACLFHIYCLLLGYLYTTLLLYYATRCVTKQTPHGKK